MNSSARVAIVVLNWNRKNDTLECLSSLYRSSYSNLDVFMIDNGSTDGTVEAVQERFPEVGIVQNGRNLGYAEGNNVGIRRALERGASYILVLNNDTVVDSSALAYLVAASDSYPDAGAFSPKINWYSQPNVIWFAGARWSPERAAFDHLRSGEADDHDDSETPYETDYASGCALFAKAEVFLTVGLFDPLFFLMWEETDWCYRARRHGYRNMIEPRAKVWHKVSSSFENGWSGTQSQYYMTRNRLLWIEKNLRGRERVRAFIRCLRELNWWSAELRQPGKSQEEYALFRARLLGGWHYVTRRFGQGAISNLTRERIEM